MKYPDDFINKIICGDCLEVMKEMPDKCVDLLIADPPYYKVKGCFDFVWENFKEYLKDVTRWASACKRILKENGTLYWFGDSRKIAYTQVIFDKHFGLLNNLVWVKAENDGLYGSSGSEKIRCFPNSSERILMYSNDCYNLTQCVYSIRDYIRGEIIKAKGVIVHKDINRALGAATNGGGVSSACLSLKKAEPAMFTEAMYKKLRNWLNSGREYEYLRREYEDLRREFNNKYNMTEIIKVRFKPTNIAHDTVKPVVLIKRLIETSSRDGSVILDPFLGSGTTAIACKELNRKYIGIEISPEYCKIAEERIKEYDKQLRLF